MNASSQDTKSKWSFRLTLGALGVVYGDIGTSPLYTMRECFHRANGMAPTPDNVIGILSLLIWSLILIVSVKYLLFVLRADNKGEGGILALLALAFGDSVKSGRGNRAYIALAVFGAALLYGDGMITPAVTVLGAIEGLEVATPLFSPYIVPLAVVILLVLFSIQRIGTGLVGRAFGPITLVWFIALALLGLRGLLMHPGVLSAFNPWHGFHFLAHSGRMAWPPLGSVFLAVTGAEALYADLGHFGSKPIRVAWFAAVLPSLLLNYLGQGALLIADPTAIANPFFRLSPGWALYPMVLLAAMAAAVASQAMISGVFSLSMQAIQLGYLPRMEIRHTSARERGQIYLPLVNSFLLVACVGLVLFFRSSSDLAAAYGIAVSLTMMITTLLFYAAARKLWRWSRIQAMLICGLFLFFELPFSAANLLKLGQGGWLPLLIATAIFTVMTTWKTGRRLLGRRLAAGLLPLDLFLADIRRQPPTRVGGSAIFMSSNPEGTPIALLHNLRHNRVLHERSVILSISISETAHVHPSKRVVVETLGEGLYRVIATFGFMDDPSMREVLESCAQQGLALSVREATFFLGRETVVPSSRPGMARWRQGLFSFLARNAQSATAFFHLPANRVVELGLQVEV